MEKSESDHVKLFYMLFDALSRITGETEYFKNLKIPQTTLGAGVDIERYSEILISLFNNIDKKTNIVLDDLESFDENGSSYSLIQNIIKEIPVNISIFLLSRQMPPLSIEKMKMAKKAVALNNEDLKFTLDETKMFFTERKQQGPIDLAQIKKIQAATEGWAGGLTLVSESMRRSTDLNKIPDHFTGDAFSFFSEEIYSSLPGNIKDFLVKTSLFEVIDPEILSSFFADVPDPEKILKQLEKRNLFIQKVDSSGKWSVFRYNKLFKTFLKRALLREISTDEYKKLNVEAGRIFQQRKEYEQALKYFIEGDAHKDIGRIIKSIGTDYVIKGRFTDLTKWMQALPNEMIWKDPWLIFYLTVTKRIKGGVQNIADFKIALSLFEQQDDIRGQILCIAYLIEAAVFMRKPFASIVKFISKGEKLLKPRDDKLLFTWARALLWQQIGFGYIAGNGDILRGISACQNAVVLAGRINNPNLKLNASIVMILGYVQAGEFTNAQDFLSRIQGLTKEGIHPEYRALKNLVNIDFAMKKGEFELSETLLLKSETDIEKFGLLFLYPGFLEAKSMYYIYVKNYEEAIRTADYLSDFSTLEGNDFYKAIACGIKAVSLYHKAEYNDAQTQCLKALKMMKKTKRSDIHLFWVKQIHGFILLHQKKYKQAEKELKSCLEYYEQISSDLSYTETSLALGALMWEQDNTDEAKKYIEIGITKASKEKYVHFNVMSLGDFTKSLLLMQIHGDYQRDGSLLEYMLELLSLNSKNIPNEIESILSWKSKKGQKNQKDKTANLARLRQVHKLILPKLRIETLGGFEILKDNKIVENIDWEGSRPKLLLKAIIFHGGKDIPKDVLIEDIWPESNAKAGEKNFKINLHRLRKALEPEAEKNFGYSYLIHKAGQISFDPDLVTIDTDEFLNLCLQGEAEEKNNSKNKAISIYDRAIHLYKGDFFVEEPYVEWLFAKRDLFWIKYIEILQKKALLHEDLNQVELAKDSWQRILHADPLFEKAYQKLMIIYSEAGMKNKAFNIFKECKNIFKQELDIEPDSETIKIYKQVKKNKK
jgi:LuxR family maltose regulon positive regulatory protein